MKYCDCLEEENSVQTKYLKAFVYLKYDRNNPTSAYHDRDHRLSSESVPMCQRFRVYRSRLTLWRYEKLWWQQWWVWMRYHDDVTSHYGTKHTDSSSITHYRRWVNNIIPPSTSMSLFFHHINDKRVKSDQSMSRWVLSAASSYMYAYSAGDSKTDHKSWGWLLDINRGLITKCTT